MPGAAVLLGLGSFNARALPCLTNSEQVRLLSAAEARNGYPVQLSGVVLYADPLAGDLVIQDKTGGIYINGWTKHLSGSPSNFEPLHPGQFVDVTGESFPGDYAPCVTLKSLKVAGHAPIPAARPVTYEDLASGLEDGQWVEVRGIVHSAQIAQVWSDFSNRYLVLRLSLGGDEITARVMDFAGVKVDALADAEVCLDGVSMPMFTTHRQLFDVVVVAPSLANLKIQVPPPTKLYEGPASPIGSLLQFSATQRPGHRVKVAGTVLLQRSGEVFIKDNTEAIRVLTAQNTPLAPGDRLEVLGFAAHGSYSPELRDAVFRKVAAGPPPRPVPVSVEEASNGNHNDDLVQMDGLFLNFFRFAGENILVLQQSNFVFNVHFPDTDQTRLLGKLSKESLLRVTGVCEIQLDNWHQSFQLLAQSPDDVVVLRPPVWWNLPHALALLAGVTVLFAGVLGVVIGQSRRRVNAHLRAWRHAEAQFLAVNKERNRLAGELHDTLEQALVGIAMQLEAGLKAFFPAPKIALEHLEMAKQMVDQSQDEVHRSIWDLRSRMLDNNDLPSALDALGRQLSLATAIHIDVEVLGSKQRLPDMVENHLLRITQEAIANAVKHGKPRRIQVQLAFATASVSLTVRDDGTGFNAHNWSHSRQGHFGLAGMHERAKALGAVIEVESAPGAGTIIMVEVPLNPDGASPLNLEPPDPHQIFGLQASHEAKSNQHSPG